MRYDQMPYEPTSVAAWPRKQTDNKSDEKQNRTVMINEILETIVSFLIRFYMLS